MLTSPPAGRELYELEPVSPFFSRPGEECDGEDLRIPMGICFWLYLPKGSVCWFIYCRDLWVTSVNHGPFPVWNQVHFPRTISVVPNLSEYFSGGTQREDLAKCMVLGLLRGAYPPERAEELYNLYCKIYELLSADTAELLFDDNPSYYSMGCIKSKQTYSVQNSTQHEKTQTSNDKPPEETMALVVSNQEATKDESLAPNPVLLEYAHRLSEEIVDTAVKQWAENDSKYSDIPFIESDVP
ncbi:hypothetical protein NDU88_003767 [Pleurodeles waltl]|uniref:Small membrane A-kinase anchor protein n=1 Tax=Pleurodeles waltl TaxID=8319 RepID=A0AAV7UDS4_PLEWA|nr:hypothetical protein NDU88_003767 [Pleurodeles waltl]